MCQNGVHVHSELLLCEQLVPQTNLPPMCAYPYPAGLMPAAVLCCPASFGRGSFALCWLNYLLTETIFSQGVALCSCCWYIFWDNRLREALLLLLLYVLKHLSAVLLKVVKGINQVLVLIHRVFVPWLCCKLADCSGCYCQMLGVLILCCRWIKVRITFWAQMESLLLPWCLLGSPAVPALNQMRWMAISG